MWAGSALLGQWLVVGLLTLSTYYATKQNLPFGVVPRGPLVRNQLKQRDYVTTKVGKRKFGYSVSGARRGPMSARNGPALQGATCSRVETRGRADDRSKKSSRCEYVIRNRPRHTATDRRRSGSVRALSSPFLAPAPNLYLLHSLHKTRTDTRTYLRYQTFNGSFSKKEFHLKQKEEENVAEKEGGGARQGGEQAFSVHRKISQPGRGPMPVNSVGRSLTSNDVNVLCSSNINGYATGFFTVCQGALARGVHSPDAAVRNRKEASRGRHDSSQFPCEKPRRSVEKFTVKRPLKQRYLAYRANVRVKTDCCTRTKNHSRGFMIGGAMAVMRLSTTTDVTKTVVTPNDAKDHSTNKTAQWQRTFDDVGHKNRLRAPSTLRYEAHF
ncbi:Uncharacterized protein DBV15_00058 [Temnothorax longispinosus]|uniref:Uncharacterized protein n=1 Tax=Temnothorax longispinosus TaxID=300112 RepID=A0A4V3SA24_9HYME|nr:Uncharacterized protein DBV15_00058 [Temnothorax longispinosus]